MENLQLAHMCCNRQKSDKLVEKQILDAEVELISKQGSFINVHLY